MLLAQINQQYEEQRKYPRLKLGAPAVIICADKQLVECHVYDVSPDGLQIRCTRNAAMAINPSCKQISPMDKLLVNVIFSLPIRDGNKQIKVICSVYYFTLIQDAKNEEDVAFGLKFKKFDGTCGRYVEQFIMQALEPEK